MFWKKRVPTYQDAEFGLLSYFRGQWTGHRTTAEGDLLLFSVEGDEDRPDHDGLERARRLIAASSELRQVALAYLQDRSDVREFAQGNGDLVLDAIDVGKEEGAFDLSFGFTKWPDGYVTLRFTGGKPAAVMMGD